jgi:hypothetical protein
MSSGVQISQAIPGTWGSVAQGRVSRRDSLPGCFLSKNIPRGAALRTCWRKYN